MIALCALFCCTACFDIQENLFLKKDGSGNFSFIIDMSEFKSMMAMFDGVGKSLGGKDDTNESRSKDRNKEKAKAKESKSPTDKLSSAFEKTRRKLLNTPGITNVKSIEDSISLHVGVSFDFKNIASLNEAMNKLFADDDSVKTDKKPVIYFEYKDNQLIRLEALDSKSILGKSNAFTGKSTDVNSEDPLFDVSKLFSTVSYTTNYEFENKITSAKNTDAMLSSGMQKVTLKIYPFAGVKDSTKAKPTIANTITFK